MKSGGKDSKPVSFRALSTAHQARAVSRLAHSSLMVKIHVVHVVQDPPRSGGVPPKRPPSSSFLAEAAAQAIKLKAGQQAAQQAAQRTSPDAKDRSDAEDGELLDESKAQPAKKRKVESTAQPTKPHSPIVWKGGSSDKAAAKPTTTGGSKWDTADVSMSPEASPAPAAQKAAQARTAAEIALAEVAAFRAAQAGSDRDSDAQHSLPAMKPSPSVSSEDEGIAGGRNGTPNEQASRWMDRDGAHADSDNLEVSRFLALCAWA